MSYPPISLAGSQLGEARHVCAFFNKREDEYAVTLPFTRDGFECGDKVIHIIDPARRRDHLERMASFGIDTVSIQQRRQFELYDWRDTFFSEGPVNVDRQLALKENALRSGREQGFSVTRYVAHTEWALEQLGSVDSLLELEARFNQIGPRYGAAVVCAYDLTRFAGDAVIDAFRTHPVVIIGGILQQNPYFVPPDEFLREVRERRPRRTAPPSAAVEHGSAIRTDR